MDVLRKKLQGCRYGCNCKQQVSEEVESKCKVAEEGGEGGEAGGGSKRDIRISGQQEGTRSRHVRGLGVTCCCSSCSWLACRNSATSNKTCQFPRCEETSVPFNKVFLLRSIMEARFEPSEGGRAAAGRGCGTGGGYCTLSSSSCTSSSFGSASPSFPSSLLTDRDLVMSATSRESCSSFPGGEGPDETGNEGLVGVEGGSSCTVEDGKRQLASREGKSTSGMFCSTPSSSRIMVAT
eukprot:601489-Hanusia_phi.AAC.7